MLLVLRIAYHRSQHFQFRDSILKVFSLFHNLFMHHHPRPLPIATPPVLPCLPGRCLNEVMDDKFSEMKRTHLESEESTGAPQLQVKTHQQEAAEPKPKEEQPDKRGKANEVRRKRLVEGCRDEVADHEDRMKKGAGGGLQGTMGWKGEESLAAAPEELLKRRERHWRELVL